MISERYIYRELHSSRRGPFVRFVSTLFTHSHNSLPSYSILSYSLPTLPLYSQLLLPLPLHTQSLTNHLPHRIPSFPTHHYIPNPSYLSSSNIFFHLLFFNSSQLPQHNQALNPNPSNNQSTSPFLTMPSTTLTTLFTTALLLSPLISAYNPSACFASLGFPSFPESRSSISALTYDESAGKEELFAFQMEYDHAGECSSTNLQDRTSS